MSYAGIRVSKQDVLWGYVAKFFMVASGVLVLPIVLRLLTPEEIGMNYIMLSVGTLVALVDFGFSPQFARNVTYIYSGAKEIKKRGMSQVSPGIDIVVDYRLLTTLIETARWLYRIMGGTVLLLMLTGGSMYIYHITNGFSNIENSALTWLVYSLSVFFQIYYSYFTALLVGAGKIMESNKIVVYTNILKLFLTYILLMWGIGLLGLVIANLLSAIFTRYLSYKYYFTESLNLDISSNNISRKERIELFKIIWYNSKRMGTCALSGYLTQGATVMLAGVYLSLNDVATFGLMSQMLFLVQGISSIMFVIYQPRLASLQISNNRKQLLSEAAFIMCVYNILYIIGLILLLLFGDTALFVLGSQTSLPSSSVLLLAAVIWLLDGNCWNMCQLIATKNEFPFLKSILFTAIAIVLLCYINIAWLQLGILGILLSRGIPQIIYNDWFWPLYAIKELNSSVKSFISVGFYEIYKKMNVLKI